MLLLSAATAAVWFVAVASCMTSAIEHLAVAAGTLGADVAVDTLGVEPPGDAMVGDMLGAELVGNLLVGTAVVGADVWVVGAAV